MLIHEIHELYIQHNLCLLIDFGFKHDLEDKLWTVLQNRTHMIENISSDAIVFVCERRLSCKLFFGYVANFSGYVANFFGYVAHFSG